MTREIKFRKYYVNFKRYMRKDEAVCNLMDITNGSIVCNIDELETYGDKLNYYTGGSIIEQYSEHKDVNNKELYENDIILWLGEMYLIKNIKGAFIIENTDGDECEYLREIDTSNCELCGNIHENIYLLEG